MRPTIPVNLGGLQFVFNDDAYKLMSGYLQSLEEAFRAQGLDAAELSADIESRCAEILCENHDRMTYIITESDITQLIDRMGRPDEIIDVEMSDNGRQEQAGATTSDVPPYIPPSPEPLRKRLYRIKNGAELGGVCGGIAAYINWDPSYVRLITVVLAILSVSTVCIAYLVLWIVIPQAKTPLQEMELRGESPTLNNIGRTVKQAFGYNSDTKNNCGKPVYPYERLNDIPEKKTASGITRFFSILAKVLLGIFGLICVVILLGLVVAVIGGSIWGLMELLIYHHELKPHYFEMVAVIACFTVVIGMPLYVIVWMILRALFKLNLQNKLSPAWRVSLFIIWMTTMLLMIRMMKYLSFINF